MPLVPPPTSMAESHTEQASAEGVGTAGLSRSTILAGSGLLMLGISASVYLVVSARMVGPVEFSGIAVLWTLVYTLGIGVFLPFEHELSRATSVRRAQDQGVGAVVGRTAQVAAGAFLAVVLLVLLMMAVPGARVQLLADSWWYAAGLLVAVAGLGAQYVQRGLFSATGDFRAYGAQQGVEGLARTLACAGLAVASVNDARAYVAVLAISPHLSVLVLARHMRRATGAPGPPAHWAELRERFGWLLAATLASQALANLAAPVVRILSSPRQVEAAGNFLSALTVARIPLLLFAAVQAVLLPRLTRARHRGDRNDFLGQLRVVLWVTALTGAAGVLAVAVAGEPVLRLLFGEGFGLPRLDLVLLAASAALLMLGLALQAAVVALDDHRWSGLSWVAGLVVFLLALAVPLQVFLRVELALILGSVVVGVALGAGVRRRLSASWVSSDSGSKAAFRG